MVCCTASPWPHQDLLQAKLLSVAMQPGNFPGIHIMHKARILLMDKVTPLTLWRVFVFHGNMGAGLWSDLDLVLLGLF